MLSHNSSVCAKCLTVFPVQNTYKVISHNTLKSILCYYFAITSIAGSSKRPEHWNYYWWWRSASYTGWNISFDCLFPLFIFIVFFSYVYNRIIHFHKLWHNPEGTMFAFIHSQFDKSISKPFLEIQSNIIMH